LIVGHATLLDTKLSYENDILSPFIINFFEGMNVNGGLIKAELGPHDYITSKIVD